MRKKRYEAEDRADVFVPHAFAEQTVDLGEVRMNHARVGKSDKPALLLIPGQSESWWGYEAALPLLAEHFEAFAVDLRGQGRSTWTPGRYTLDNMGNDLARFIDLVIGRPTVVSGLSSGGVLAAWMSAYAKPGQVRGAHYEDPPLFSSETNPACGQSIRQGAGPLFALWHKYLGDQWTIGDWAGMRSAMSRELPGWLAAAAAAGEAPPQNLREYDPEWGRAFVSGTVAAGCDHARMLRSVCVPVLMTHHFRTVNETTGALLGAMSDVQANHACELIREAGQPVDYRPFPDMGHSMHGADPELFARTLTEWAMTLAPG